MMRYDAGGLLDFYGLLEVGSEEVMPIQIDCKREVKELRACSNLACPAIDLYNNQQQSEVLLPTCRFVQHAPGNQLRNLSQS